MLRLEHHSQVAPCEALKQEQGRTLASLPFWMKAFLSQSEGATLPQHRPCQRPIRSERTEARAAPTAAPSKSSAHVFLDAVQQAVGTGSVWAVAADQLVHPFVQAACNLTGQGKRR